MPLVATWQFAENTICRMQINRPAAIRNRIILRTLLHNVLLSQHIVATKSTAFAFTRNGAYPFQRIVTGIGKIPGILYVVPDTIYNSPQFPLDRFGIFHRIEPAAILDPPEFASLFLQ
jgi:hypothetical protein